MKRFHALIDIIYPPRCLGCALFLEDNHNHRQTAHFCPDCFSDFSPVVSPLCPICSTPLVSGLQKDHLCEDCLRKRPFYEAIYALYHYEGAMMEAIHQFKYGEKRYLAKSLGPLFVQFAGSRMKQRDDLLIMPVPLHKKRLRERGFNQSLLLAKHLARQMNAELDFLSLRRVRYTLPQTGLGKEERRKNVRGAFRVENPHAVKAKTVLLVDDVATTGNTLNECARVLKKSGCKNVFCMVLAKAGHRSLHDTIPGKDSNLGKGQGNMHQDKDFRG